MKLLAFILSGFIVKLMFCLSDWALSVNDGSDGIRLMSDLQIQIRRATLKDLPQVIGLLAKVGLPVEGIAEHLKHFFISENNGDFVGVCGLQVSNNSGLLRSTAVVSAYRNKGIARKLIEASFDHAKKLGLKDIYLLTATSKEYFSKLGFESLPRDALPAEIQSTREFLEICAEAECMYISLD